MDNYQLIVETDRLVKVEDINAAIESLPEREFQENITEELARKLVGCKVTTIGWHLGAKTTCQSGQLSLAVPSLAA